MKETERKESERRQRQIIESEMIVMFSGVIAILTLIGYMITLNW